MLSEADTIADYLQLIRSENLGPQRMQILLRRFGSAKQALSALQNNAVPQWGSDAKKPIRLANYDEIENELSYAKKIGVRFLLLADEYYPAYMREIDNPPPVLAIRGNISLLNRPSLAIVGSRNASAIGGRISSQFARALSQANFTIVSGFARGIDTYAHHAALKNGTIAVLAGGVDHIYPPENKKLYHDILENDGLFISEMPLTHQPRAMDFPRRNRLIAALALGLLVVEASERSGSLISARYATEAGRIVFATPGSPLDPRAKGTNRLIKDGACLVDDPQDIIEILAPLCPQSKPQNNEISGASVRKINGRRPFFTETPSPIPASEKDIKPDKTVKNDNELSAEEKERLEQSLSLTPIAIDNLAIAVQIPLPRLYLGLMELELTGRLVRHNDGMVSVLPQ